MSQLRASITPPRLLYEVRRSLIRRPLWAIYRKYRDCTLVPGLRYVRNLELVRRSLRVPGCVVECGVWRGGMSAGLAELLGSSREYFLFDSFEGLPQVEQIDGAAASEWQKPENSHKNFNNVKVPMDEAEATMRKSGVASYHLVKGWFHDTLPRFSPPEKIALLRLDGDLYESTSTCLKFLFPLLADGALVIIDDYYDWDGCTRAVNEFLAEMNADQPVIHLRQFDDDICYLLKPRSEPVASG